VSDATGEAATVDAAGAHASSRFAADVEFARAIAVEAGRIQLERYERVESIEFKSAKDVVTEVDHLCEKLILDAIRDRFPGDGILAEESGAHQAPGAHGRPGEGSDKAGEAVARSLSSGRTWIVDPLDGTVNYANAIPYFCVSVALIVDGVSAAGAIHDPMRGETFSAVADGAAWLSTDTRGTVEIRASQKDELKDWVVHLALSGRAVASRVSAVRRATRVSRTMGSSALALAYVANGRFDAFVQSGGMSAWDVAAAGLIAERAGAIVTDTVGGPWFDVAKATSAFGVCAAAPSHHAEVLRLSGQPPKG